MAKAEIYEDDQGRRRVDRSVGPAPPTKEQRLEARLTALEKELAAAKSELAGMTITGDGFSGSGPRGIKYTDPDDEEDDGTVTVPAPPESGEYVLTSTDGVMAWEAIEDC